MAKIVIWRPQPGPQTALLTCPVFEIFYGGARGGGKTDGTLGRFIGRAGRYKEHCSGLMVRRTRTELYDTIERSRALYGPLGWKFNDTDKLWRAPDGARLKFAYLERDSDAEAYQGHNYTDLMIEELGNFPNPGPVMKMMATLRSGAGVPTQFVATGNPGGPGHQWVKARYIDPAPMGYKVITDERSGLQRVFIPAKVSDNKILTDNDPTYVAKIRQSGSPELVKAWLEGDWTVIAGAFFPEFDFFQHVVEPFEIPAHWTRFRSGDWGSARPFAFYWYAVSDGENPRFPRGALIVYREWYGCTEPNVGLKLTAEEVAAGIKARDGDEKIQYGALDPAAFSQDGGPSIAERMLTSHGVVWSKADNKRTATAGAIGGWDQVRARLKGLHDDKPMLYVFSTCTHLIRTLPAMQHDENRPEDLDSDGEDHACFAAGTLVQTPTGPVAIEKLPRNGLIATRQGVKAYVNAGMTAANANRVRLTFSDGSAVVCTPDHRFISEVGWTQAKDLMGLSLPAVRLCKSSTANGFIDAARTFSAKVFDFIGRCGNGITETFRRAFTFITWTMIAATMPLTTWNCWPRQSTSVITPRVARWHLARTRWQKLPTGISPTLAGNGMSSIGAKTARTFIRQRLCAVVTNAAKNMKRRLSGFLSAVFAPTTARHVRCVSVEPTSAGPVYCLAALSPQREFLLASGIAVHNCDSLRYGCMSRPYVKDAPNTPKARFEGELTFNELIERQRRRREAEWQ